MTTRITILGLGKTGISIGLSLAGEKKGITRIGFDEDKELIKIAKKAKAFDEYATNIDAAVSRADIVALDIPVDRLRTVFVSIAPKMKNNSIIINLAPLASASARWAQELLPATIHFINMIPALNYDSLDDVLKDPKQARADLFEKSLI